MSNSVDSEDTLNIMRWIPGSIKNDHTRRRHQVNSQTSGFSRDDEQTRLSVRNVVEFVYELGPSLEPENFGFGRVLARLLAVHYVISIYLFTIKEG